MAHLLLANAKKVAIVFQVVLIEETILYPPSFLGHANRKSVHSTFVKFNSEIWEMKQTMGGEWAAQEEWSSSLSQ